MKAENLSELISRLTPDEQEAVREFVEFIKNKKEAPFLGAVEEFIAAHPELLRLLAK